MTVATDQAQAAPAIDAQAPDIPLCVDLDGTLVRSDLLLESLLALARQDPWALLRVPFWLLRGRAHLKDQLARRVALDPQALPYNEALLAFLRAEHRAGRPLVLATATHEALARRVADHLGLFEQVVASDAACNCKGAVKLARLEEALASEGFDYAGNDRSDLALWSRARRAILVNAPARVASAAARLAEVERVFHDGGLQLAPYVKALRLHQWLKNGLVFVPLLVGHRYGEPQLVIQAGLAFLAFGLAASGTYLVNDGLDLAADRRHPRKRYRPMASGDLPLVHALVLVPLLVGGALAIALAVSWLLAAALMLYLATTLLYSVWLKQLALVDVLTLAGLYTVRVIGGAAAIAVVPSFWLLAFSMFVFLSLALIKRYTELLAMAGEGEAAAPGRGYALDDADMLRSIGTSSGLMAVLVLALYIHSPQVEALYSHPRLIWLVLPLLLYWIVRLWLKAHRGLMHDDPLVFAATDRVSQVVLLASVAILWAAL